MTDTLKINEIWECKSKQEHPIGCVFIYLTPQNVERCGSAVEAATSSKLKTLLAEKWELIRWVVSPEFPLCPSPPFTVAALLTKRLIILKGISEDCPGPCFGPLGRWGSSRKRLSIELRPRSMSLAAVAVWIALGVGDAPLIPQNLILPTRMGRKGPMRGGLW